MLKNTSNEGVSYKIWHFELDAGPLPTNLGFRGFGELTLSMAECEGLVLVTLAKTEK